MAPYAMIDMELDDEDALDAVMPIPMPEKPQYPYGLRICLTEKEFEKLGLDPKDAFVGGMIHGHFMARVTCCSMNDSPDGETHRCELQIESLAIESESEDAENAKE
jgi:hypothetical protein